MPGCGLLLLQHTVFPPYQGQVKEVARMCHPWHTCVPALAHFWGCSCRSILRCCSGFWFIRLGAGWSIGWQIPAFDAEHFVRLVECHLGQLQDGSMFPVAARSSWVCSSRWANGSRPMGRWRAEDCLKRCSARHCRCGSWALRAGSAGRRAAACRSLAGYLRLKPVNPSDSIRIQNPEARIKKNYIGSSWCAFNVETDVAAGSTARRNFARIELAVGQSE